MSAKTCVCFVCDEGYLFPTLLAAVQARGASPTDRADVAVFMIGPATPAAGAFADAFCRHGVRFRAFPESIIEGRPIHCARFFLDRMLNDAYRDFLYLDGDVQVHGDLTELIDLDLGGRGVAAIRDPMAYMITRTTQQWTELRDYFQSIGLAASAMRDYFNSGIIRASRDAWLQAASDCLRIIDRSSRGFRFPDQDPLNLVLNSQYAPLATRWNFPIFLKSWRRYDAIRPRIVHFMSNPRPWQMACRPWGEEGTQPYLDLVRSHPELACFQVRASAARRLRYHAQQFYKSVVEGWQWDSRRVFETIASADQTCVI
jgi:lipopolysaccharide biosynthesis glycosyltransferase